MIAICRQDQDAAEACACLQQEYSKESRESRMDVKGGSCTAIVILCCIVSGVGAACVPSGGCRALASYNVSENEQLNLVYYRFSVTLTQLREYNDIPNQDTVLAGQGIFIPFNCTCNEGILSHNFQFNNVSSTDTIEKINTIYYHGLSDSASIAAANPSGIFPGTPVQVPVNCSCGDPQYPRYGLFMTYVVQTQETADTIAQKFNTTREDLTRYNPGVQLNALSANSSHLFIPARTLNGAYPPFSDNGESTSKSNTAVVVGASVGGGIAVILALAAVFWFCVYLPRKKSRRVQYHQSNLGSGNAFADTKQGLFRTPDGATTGSVRAGFSDFTVDKSVEFSYEELAASTDNFSLSRKIGEGGYGAVYYAEIRDQKLAIKKMNLQATKEFMSELKVLTHVHHTNLVQLIGYCTVESLFLVYEYVDNGTLSQHLRGSGKPPLTWNQRVQIALDAARGLEYIHEHTKPSYIHRDVKSPNILIDKNFHAKVADFGLTKLTESTAGGSASLTQPTRLVGTFGYMPPEYARFGDVSPKIDVYSFGVVLYEIISSKDAIVRTADGDDRNGEPNYSALPRGLVTLFDTALKGPNPEENLKSLVDPGLGTNYPFESVWKLAKLAEACTQETPENRPNMRTVVVALMTLCTSTQELDLNSYSDAQIHGLVSGR